ncbi:MAG: lysophospholipid acyltransferase family protein [Oligoflexia bacterium]|nr:lysophospholipid acyltransferase family protein [Oligoflexia bacterium]
MEKEEKSLKKLIKIIFFQAQVYFIYAVLNLLAKSYRMRVQGNEHLTTAPRNGVLVALWHEQMVANLLSRIKAAKSQRYAVLVSMSKDGELATQIVNLFKFRVVRGSSSRGGAHARAEILQLMQQEHLIMAITVDGPRGPRRACRPGILDLSIRSGAAIIPAVSVARWCWVFKRSWDQFKLPLPFSKVVVRFGEPLIFGIEEEHADLFKLKSLVGAALHANEQLAQEELDRWQ